jgi:hypothetical protein
MKKLTPVSISWDQLHPCRAIEYRVQGTRGFQPGKPGPHAEMNAVPEPQMRLGLGGASLEAERVGILEDFFVAIRRCVTHRYGGPGRNRATADFDVDARNPEQDLYWPIQAESFLYRQWHKTSIRPYALIGPGRPA